MNTALYKALTSVGADEGLAIKAAENMPSEAATKTDIAELRTATQADIAELRTSITELRAATQVDIAELRVEMKEDIAELRTEMKEDMAELRTGVKADIAELRTGISNLRAWLMWRLMFAMGAQVGLFVALVKLMGV